MSIVLEIGISYREHMIVDEVAHFSDHFWAELREAVIYLLLIFGVFGSNILIV